MESARFVIAGAGLAGAATAYQLARRGSTDVLLVEREARPGRHASGQNAGMVRQVVDDPAIAPLAREGALSIASLAGGGETGGIFRRTGSLLLATARSVQALRRAMEVSRQSGVTPELWNRRRLIRHVPALEGAAYRAAVWCPDDGVVDAAALLAHCLEWAKQQGARVWTGVEVCGMEGRGGWVVVRTSRGPIRTAALVNAAGAWAGELGRRVGGIAIPLRPFRRHIFVTKDLSGLDPSWPFVWDEEHGWYFRLEAGGLLASPCDEQEWSATQPPCDPLLLRRLLRKLSRHVPRVGTAFDLQDIARGWAGLRTFVPDRRFVIGWDPRRRGLYWLAGLGGCGVTTCLAVGKIAAEQLLAGPGREHGAEVFSPARFVR